MREETTQKIKETVVGKSDDDCVEDHVRKPAREEHKEKSADEDMVDTRRRRSEEQDHDHIY